MEARLQQLHRRRAEQTHHVKSTTSGATARDVQLVACQVANRLCLTLDNDGVGSGSSVTAGGGGAGAAGAKSVAVALASSGGVDAVALVLRMFEASDAKDEG